jgi:hypothetical protein
MGLFKRGREMDVEEAERHLKDNLLNGIATEIFWADEAYALAQEIGKHAQALKPTASMRSTDRCR